MKHFYLIIFCILTSLFFSCQEENSSTGQQGPFPRLFQEQSPANSGIDFTNKVEDQEDFNVLTYRNYYNGGGVAIGDINNDSLPDVFLTANMAENKLYLNKGELTFQDVTSTAKIGGTGSWSTGVSMADVNGDGWLDIYVCNSGDAKGGNKANELFINQKNGTFIESAKAYNLDDEGFSTHASFFDYDQDGDLDAYILNNSFKDPSRIDFKNLRNIRDKEGGDRLMRNDGNTFTDVSAEAGIFGSEIGFGLGVSVSDLNADMLPDIYISNDFWERDYLYLNKGNGVFEEQLPNRISMTSTASMGADIADIDNDGAYDIFSTDMLPATNERLKTTTIFNDYNLQDRKFRNDYHYQFTQNCLQYNDGNANFTEAAFLAGVASTDWSWASLIFDFDNDGWKDIFVSNGVYHDITDMDFSDFIEDEQSIKKIVSEKGRFDFRDFLDYLPSTPLSNYAFVNQRDRTFQNKAQDLGLGKPGFSNGSAYADLDLDGDLDLIVNNVNQVASLYKNVSSEKTNNHYVRLKFVGEKKNPFGIGATVDLKLTKNTLTFQNYQTRGFQSSTEPILTIGVGEADVIDKLIVKWPTGKTQELTNVNVNKTIVLKEAQAINKLLKAPSSVDKPLTKESDLFLTDAIHKENVFSDFDFESLLPHMISTEGPELMTGDVNGDNKDDVILLGATGQADQLFIQSNGKWQAKKQASFEKDANSESVCGLLIDMDGDADLDLLVGSGGNDPSKGPENYVLKMYHNDGQGNFEPIFFEGIKAIGNFSCIKAVNMGNGVNALFLGSRIIPGNYGLPPRNYLFVPKQNGWQDVSTQALGQCGMVTDAVSVDLDEDGDDELVVVGEWMPITIFENTGSELKLKGTIKNSNGLWQSVEIADLNKDGKPDIVAGNWGTNSKLQASVDKPLSMYVADFDNNKKTEFIINWFAYEDQEPGLFAGKRDLVGQIPALKKSILKNEDYAKAKLEDILTEEQIENSIRLNVNQLQTSVFLNTGAYVFKELPLPQEAQLAPMFSISVDDFDADDIPDMILGGNMYGCKPEVGRLNSSTGVFLKGKGDGEFTSIPSNESGVFTKGEIRDIKTIELGSKKIVLIGRNNESIEAYSY